MYFAFDLLNCAHVQSVANMPPSGESLKILAKDLGSRVYTKYSVQMKHQNWMVEKLGRIYNAYTELLAKDTKVRLDTLLANFRPNTVLHNVALLES